jgi:hypothetical protein
MAMVGEHMVETKLFTHQPGRRKEEEGAGQP